jgi:lysozyme family protein
MTMTPRFLAFMPFIFEWEGGYDNDPDDPGGETKYGIDKRSHPGEDIKNLSKLRAQQIYWDEYWQPVRSDELPAGIGEVVMNIGVNAGKGRASKWLQQAIGVTADGNIGPRTIAAAHIFEGDLARVLLDRTEDHYRSIARGRMAKYLRGWLNRNNSLREHIQRANGTHA